MIVEVVELFVGETLRMQLVGRVSLAQRAICSHPAIRQTGPSKHAGMSNRATYDCTQLPECAVHFEMKQNAFISRVTFEVRRKVSYLNYGSESPT